MKKVKINIIAAVANDNVIGKDNKLIWHISEDLKRFKKLTSGRPIIMGRKTYESLPFRPLPKRKNIVISRQKDLVFDGAIVVNNFENAIKECNSKDVFICGGEEIYKHYIDIADVLCITKVFAKFEGDSFFPDYSNENWEEVYASEIKYDEKSKLSYQFCEYIKK